MSAKDNLQLARKYEWNASMARLQGNTREADRYESMSKMAMIDAGISMTRDNNLSMPQNSASTTTTFFRHEATTKEDLKSPSYWLGWAIAVVLLGGSAIVGFLM